MADDIATPAPAATTPETPPAGDPADKPTPTADLQAKLEAAEAKLAKSVEAEKRLRSRTKEAEAQVAKLAEYEDADRKRKESEMSEVEKAAARAQELEDKLTATTSELEATKRQAAIASAGVSDTYQGFVSYELSAALQADPSMDVPAWIAAYKADHSEMFGNGSGSHTPAPKTGEGGPGTTGPKGAGDAAAMVAQYKQVSGSSRPEHMQDRLRLAKDYRDLTGQDIRFAID